VTEWEAVDRYFERLLVPPLRDFDAGGVPPHEVTPLQGRLLELLVRLAGAREWAKSSTCASVRLPRASASSTARSTSSSSTPTSARVRTTVVRGGAVADAEAGDPSLTGVRRFLELVGEHPRLDATAIQTVGAKGWHGFALALVR
jgi:hypothetical protein